MPLIKLKKVNFYKDFSEKGEVPLFYESIFNQTNSQTVLNTKSYSSSVFQRVITIVHLIPPYFNLRLNNNHGAVEVKSHNGYLADFRDFSTFNSYFLAQFSSNGRKLLKRRLSRLEKCFKIDYGIYYGQNIEKVHYHFLFGELKNMIETRFAQRGQQHDHLSHWDFYLESSFNKVLNKEASLFVIYNDKQPIAISLNFLHQNIFISALDSYAIDFSKFGLGNILIMKKMEWCFKNNFSVFNMGYGDLKYKQHWCNYVYKFSTQLVFFRGNFLDSVLAKILSRFFSLKISCQKKLLSIKAKTMRPTITNEYNQDLSFQIIESKVYEKLKSDSTVKKVDVKTESNSFLRKPVYDFQYKTSETSEDIEVLAAGDKVYLISGKATYGILKAPKGN